MYRILQKEKKKKKKRQHHLKREKNKNKRIDSFMILPNYEKLN
jgi:hypothetical protein